MKVLSVVLLVDMCVCASQSQCNTNSMKIVMESRYNESGYWQSQVDLKQAGRGMDKTHPWTIDVQQVSSDCDEENFALHTTILLTAPYGRFKQQRFVPPGYEYVEGIGVIKKSSGVKTYVEATRDCKRDGATILLVDTKAKLDFVNRFMENPAVFVGAPNNNDIWGGVELRGGVWTTVRGVPIEEIPFLEWPSGRPVDGHCTLFSKPKQGPWDVNTCATRKQSYICER